jgi:hypothetical protein
LECNEVYKEMNEALAKSLELEHKKLEEFQRDLQLFVQEVSREEGLRNT